MRLLRLRDVDRPRAPDRRLRRRLRHRHRRRRARRELPDATSVFFGGGTPSLLAAGALVRVLDDDPARTTAPRSRSSATPTRSTTRSSRAYRRAGVNRLSFGVQSMRPHVLAALGPHARPGERRARRSRWRATPAFDDVNVDLIYGTPGETLDDWRSTARRRARARSRARQRVRAHRRTRDAARPQRRGRLAPSRRTTTTRPTSTRSPTTCSPRRVSRGTRYRTGRGRATSAGTTAATGTAASTSAIGCAAHGYTGGRRWWNVRTPERYIERIARGRRPVAGDEHARRRGARRGGVRRSRCGRGAGAAVAPPAAARCAELGGRGLLEPSRRRAPSLTARRPARWRPTSPPASCSPGAAPDTAASGRRLGLALGTIECQRRSPCPGRRTASRPRMHRSHERTPMQPGRPQGRDPASDRRAVRRARPAGRARRPSRRPPTCGSRPRRSATRWACSSARATSPSRTPRRAGSPPTSATATTSTTSPARPRSRRPSAAASPSSSPRRRG